MKKTESIVIRLSELTKRQLELAADARQTSLSEFVRSEALRAAQRALGANMPTFDNSSP